MDESLGTMHERAPDPVDTDPKTGMQLAFCGFGFSGDGLSSSSFLIVGIAEGVSEISAIFVNESCSLAAMLVFWLLSPAFEAVSNP